MLYFAGTELNNQIARAAFINESTKIEYFHIVYYFFNIFTFYVFLLHRFHLMSRLWQNRLLWILNFYSILMLSLIYMYIQS